jgi:hypothetical protein
VSIDIIISAFCLSVLHSRKVFMLEDEYMLNDIHDCVNG